MKNTLGQFVLNFLKKAKFDQQSLATAKRKFAKRQSLGMPRNSQILAAYRQLLDTKKIKKVKDFEELLRLKKIRTLSGVCPIAVLVKPYPCPGKCLYCPTQDKIPKSYLSDEPAVMRAINCGFEAYKQVALRIQQYTTTGHFPEKIELIVMGGTWSVLQKNYKINFITDCFRACNLFKDSPSRNDSQRTLLPVGKGKSKLGILRDCPSSNINEKILKKEQKQNETAKYRIVGLTLETRPDQITEDEIKLMRILGCTRVEIGVQTVFDQILKLVNRGHGVQATIKATRLLKDAGFKVCYHLMPNLPGSNFQKDLQLFQKIFTDSCLKPDMIKIYPCVVTYQAKLYTWFKKGKYTPYTEKELIDLLTKIKQMVPEWVRINRLGRDIPIGNIAGGFKTSNIRQVVQMTMKEKKLSCNCIRCREIRSSKDTSDGGPPAGGTPRRWRIQLKTLVYSSSGGKEHFLQYVDEKNRLYALLRLRFPSYLFTGKKHFLPSLQDAAIVRELHTFGQALPIEGGWKKIQHQGLGKKLLAKAEDIAKKRGSLKIVIIAGVGAREYYRKLGYRAEETYMVKYLSRRE